MRIWLDKIGVKRRDRPEGWNKPFRRRVRCCLQRNTYGVDPRETYDLYFAWRMWLYEHLKMYLKEAEPVIDLNGEFIEYCGEFHSQLELINMMLQRLEYSLDPDSGFDDYDAQDSAYVAEVEKIWAVIAPYMWW